MKSASLRVGNKTKQRSTTIEAEIPQEHVEIPKNVRDLFLAIDAGDLRKIRTLLIADKTIVNAEYEPDVTPLSMAAGRGLTKVVSLLLQNHANANKMYARADNATILHSAAEAGQQAIVDLLLPYANVQVAKCDGATPLHGAAQNGHVKIVETLLKHNANLQAKNSRGQTPLHLATYNGHFAVVEILLQHNAEVDLPTTGGVTPLRIAVNKGYLNLAESLLKHGANIQATYADGKTLLHLASQNRHLKIVKLLLNYNANIDAVDNRNITPLYIAALIGHVEIMALLLEHNANIDIAHEKKTPLEVAKKTGHLQVVHLLESHQALCAAIRAQDVSEVKRLLADNAILANQDKKLLLPPELSPMLAELEKKKISIAFSSVGFKFLPKTMYFDNELLVIDFKNVIETSYFLDAISILFKPVHCERTHSNVRLHWPFFIDDAFTEIGLYRKRKNQLEKQLLSLQKRLKGTSWVITAITPGPNEMSRNLRIFFQGTPVDSFELKEAHVSITAAPEGITVELPMEFLLAQEKKALLNAYVRKITDKIAENEAKEAPIQEMKRAQKEEEALERLRISAQIKEEKEKEEKKIRRLQAQNKKKEVAFNPPGKENPLLNEKEALESDRLKPSDEKQALRKREPNFFASSVAPKSPKQFDQRNSHSSSSSSSSSGYSGPSPK